MAFSPEVFTYDNLRREAEEFLGEHHQSLSIPTPIEEIVEFDLQDVRDADIILVNYNKPSIGTAMEVFYASHDLQKFVVGFSTFEFKECNPWMVKF